METHYKYKSLLGIGALVGFIATSGCAKSCDQVNAQGGYFTSSKAPYIVIKQSGGRITDVYKLSEAIVQSEQHSDGWLFLDEAGHPTYIGGDVKTIRLLTTFDPLWERYYEYHMEFETKPYEQLHPSVEVQSEEPIQKAPINLPLEQQVQQLGK